MLSNYSHIFFDVDGVLISSIPYYTKLFRQVAEQLGASKTITDTQYRNMIGKPAVLALAEIIPVKNHKKIVALFDELNQEGTNSDYITVVPLAELLLLKIKQHKQKIALITTKSREGVDLLINSLKWNNYIDFAISGSEVKEFKPDPEGILKAIDYFQVEKKSVIFIGDSSHDLEASIRAGIDFCGVLTGVSSADYWQQKQVNYVNSIADFL